MHSKSSNIACWGDTGRSPLTIQLIKQTFDYYRRLQDLDISNSDSLVRHAFVEQRHNMLPWYSNTVNFIKNIGLSTEASSSQIRDRLGELFHEIWLDVARSSTKLTFYTKIKSSISYEPYLNIKDVFKRRAVAKLRSSSHQLNVETGRYTNNRLSSNQDTRIWNKCCKSCSNGEVESLISLPFTAPHIIEDEHHVLVSCPRYHHFRLNLSDGIKSALMTWETTRIVEIFDEKHIKEFATYVLNIFNTRFQKKRAA